MPLNESEIRAEIERRKQRAEELGLARVVFRLWNEHLIYLKPDFEYETSCMPKSLTKVIRNSESDRGYSLDTIELFFGDSCVKFTFYENRTHLPDGEICTTGDIIIEIDGKSVFDLGCTCEEVRYVGNEWRAGEIKGFIEGSWIEEVKRLEQQVSSLSAERDKKLQSERSQSEMEKLKTKFGL
jgi:hypothetical protein